MRARTCAVIPAFLEGERIGPLVREAARHVARVIVVDDGSPDATGERAAAAGAEVVSHATNRGKGEAVRSGLARAEEAGYEWVLLMDGDGQHDPADIPRLLRAAEDGSGDLLIGVRPLDGDSTAARRVTNRIATRILSRWIGIPLRDSQSGFRLVRLEALRGIRLTSRRFEIETEMLLRLSRRGARLVEVPTSASGPPSRPSHLRPVRDVVRNCLYALGVRYLSR